MRPGAGFLTVLVFCIISSAGTRPEPRTLLQLASALVDDFDEHLQRSGVTTVTPRARTQPLEHAEAARSAGEGADSQHEKRALCSGVGVQRPTEEVCVSNQCTVTSFSCAGGIVAPSVRLRCTVSLR